MNHAAIEELISSLIQSTYDIFQLDLREEANLGLLFSLQDKQADLRAQIEQQLDSEQRSFSEHELGLLKECLTIEQMNANKFESTKGWTSGQLNLVQRGKVHRDTYQSDFAQINGFFIDKHR